MYTLLTVIRKKPEITTERFRHFMEFEYGPTYSAMPETRRYIHYYLSDMMPDAAEQPIDAIVEISFDSQEAMREAMKKAIQSEGYKAALKLRDGIMQDTSTGIHSAVVEKVVQLV